MIRKENRFSGNNSLLYVYRRGRTLRSKYFAVKFIDHNRRDAYRAAVVVSKKVSKSAPTRNRIRRRLYELVMKFEDKLDNQDMVITVFDERVADVPFEELETAYRRIIRQVVSQHS